MRSVPAGALLALLALLPVASQEPASRPDEPEAAIRQQIQAGRLDEALRLLEEALRARPDSGPLRLLAAQALYLRARRIAEDPRLVQTVREEMASAEEEARAALAALPGSRDARMVLAQAIYYQNRLEEAEEETRKVLEATPGDGGAAFLLGEILFLLADRAAREGEGERGAALRKEAGARYEAALKAGTRVAACWHRLGNLAAHAGDLSGALGLYRRALALDASEAPHAWLLAMAPQAGPAGVAPEQLITLYRNSAAARKQAGDAPGAAFLLAQAGLLLEGEKAWPEARAAALGALVLDPEGQWHALYRAGWCSYWMNDLKAAEQAFLQLVRTRRKQFCDHLQERASEGKTAAAMMHALSSAAVTQGRLADGRDFSLLLAVARGKAADWNNYAFLCRETRQYEQAWEGYGRALEREPEDPRYLNDGALILHYHLHRDLELAAEMYQKAIASAEAILASRDSMPGDRARAAEALGDARANLALLRRRKE